MFDCTLLHDHVTLITSKLLTNYFTEKRKRGHPHESMKKSMFHRMNQGFLKPLMKYRFKVAAATYNRCCIENEEPIVAGSLLFVNGEEL